MRRNTYLLALSLDSTPSNLAWIYNIYRSTGIQIPFPVISDRNANISRLYGTLSSDNVNNTRKVYILDPNQQIRAIIDYPANIGRNIAEILRVIDALQISDKDNVLTPANWLPSQPVINYPPTSYDQLVDVSKNANNLNCLDWYLCYKQLNDNFPALDNENPFLNNCNTNQNFR